MDYSIIIPVFNKAGLTRHLLETIRPTLEGAGEGEIIVIDNASSDETPQMLQAFPWVRVIRNEINRGFSGANNQGAQLAHGKFLVLLNNDMETRPGWLASLLQTARDPQVGAVGARLLFSNGTLQHAGVAIDPVHVGTPAFVAFHDMYQLPEDYEPAAHVREQQVVTGACLLTPKSLYERLGGLDEGFWNGYEDIDYCLKVRDAGYRVVYDGRAVITHFESQSGPQRFRRVSWNVARLAHRWNGRVRSDAQAHALMRGQVRRHIRTALKHYVENIAVPRTQVICHGEVAPDARDRLNDALRANVAPIERIDFVSAGDATAFARQAMELRGDRYLAFVDARSGLQPGWLDELIVQVEFSPNTGCATYAPEYVREEGGVLSADARCTLVALRKYPQHLRLDASRPLDDALADFLIWGIECGAGTRATAGPLASLPVAALETAPKQSADPMDVERVLRARPGKRRGLVSIIMLSWNALEFTKMALQSIRQHTTGEYEIVIVDNGSNAETVEWLRSQSGVRVIFNPVNRGYAGGNNQAIAVCRGEYIVLLNNDVIVTGGWLEALLGAFDRIPGLGVSAPLSNNIAGHQQTADSVYGNLDEMQAYARRRYERHRGEGYLTDRVIGFCMCIDRRVIEEIGGIDEGFGVGNFEDDDFCIRVRAAGYKIYVCTDSFIHHFGSKTFEANNVDWQTTMARNWIRFARKWGYKEAGFGGSYKPLQAIAGGFDRARHFVPLPRVDVPASASGNRALAFATQVRDEHDWNAAGAFVRRYLRAFSAADPVVLLIRTGGTLTDDTVRARVARAVERAGVKVEEAPAIAIGSQGNADAESLVAIDALDDQSPSALRRLLAAPVGS